MTAWAARPAFPYSFVLPVDGVLLGCPRVLAVGDDLGWAAPAGDRPCPVGLPTQLDEAACWFAYLAWCPYAQAHPGDLDHPELTPFANLDVREALFSAGLAEPDSGGDAMWTRPSRLWSGAPS